MRKKKETRGRKKLEFKRNVFLSFTLYPWQRNRIIEAAEIKRVSTNQWLRELACREVGIDPEAKLPPDRESMKEPSNG